MKALVIYESMWGNTKSVAESISTGLSDFAEVSLVAVNDAPALVPGDVDLVVIGGPTHAFSMSRASTRGDAVHRGATPASGGGIREWLESRPSGVRHPQLAAFDTRVKMRFMPGSASKAAAKEAGRGGFEVRASEGFYVDGYEGPVLEGELDRALAWGRALGTPVVAAGR